MPMLPGTSYLLSILLKRLHSLIKSIEAECISSHECSVCSYRRLRISSVASATLFFYSTLCLVTWGEFASSAGGFFRSSNFRWISEWTERENVVKFRSSKKGGSEFAASVTWFGKWIEECADHCQKKSNRCKWTRKEKLSETLNIPTYLFVPFSFSPLSSLLLSYPKMDLSKSKTAFGWSSAEFCLSGGR